MISFYPGPSRVHDEIPEYVKEACKKGILSINHRSPEFMAISEKTISLLRAKLEIPVDYTVLYTTSATECWEIIAQSVIGKSSYHFFNGAFVKICLASKLLSQCMNSVAHRRQVNKIGETCR